MAVNSSTIIHALLQNAGPSFYTKSSLLQEWQPACRTKESPVFVREIVGYERYDTPEAVRWLNDIYAILDPYVNFFLPMRKVIAKQREGSKIQKRNNTAKHR